MRFSLQLLFATIAFIAAVFAITPRHGLFGLVLLVPHAMAFATVFSLWARRRVIAVTCFVVYVSSWGITHHFGTLSIRQSLTSSMRQTTVGIQELDYDPVLDDSRSHVSPPWMYVGHASSPCPFVVSVEHASRLAPSMGNGHDTYFVWCFGHSFVLRNYVTWLS